MKHILQVVAGLTLVLAASTSSMAAEAESSGVYAGLSVGQGGGVDNLFQKGAAVGYRFNNNLSAEVFYRDFGWLAGWLDENAVKTTGVAALGRLPFNESWGGYARLGVSRTEMGKPLFNNSKSPDSTRYLTDPTIGVGIDFTTQGKHLIWRVEHTQFTKSKANTTLVSAIWQF